jgi:hypothetical protein
MVCGIYTAAETEVGELVTLAETAPSWKAIGMMKKGSLLVRTGKASETVELINAGISEWRSTAATLWIPWHLSCLATAYAQLSRFDDAWRCVSEGATVVERTKERWSEAEVHRVGGEIALKSPDPDLAKAEAYFERALTVARQQQAKS